MRGPEQWRDDARQLRRDSTDAERKLWSYLRGKRMGGFKFRRQHPIAGFIADFCCVQRRLIIELDGSQHQEDEAYDASRTKHLNSLGYRVIRFDNLDVLKDIDTVLERIQNSLELPLLVVSVEVARG